MLDSDFRPLCAVRLPFRGRQHYMHPFDLAKPVMARGLEDYLGPVKALCQAAGAWRGIAYLTVDEKVVGPGQSQRRPKPHVDGCFIPQQKSWGHGSWSHDKKGSTTEPFQRMPVIIAASAVGARAWRGLFDAAPASDGDLSHLNLDEGEVLSANRGYLLSPDCVHESMPMKAATQRSFLRIALPVDFHFEADVTLHVPAHVSAVSPDDDADVSPCTSR